MTDTRKEFDEWKTKRDIETNNSPIMPFEIWQACQQLNDKRIQQLLAVIELQRQALKYYADGGHIRHLSNGECAFEYGDIAQSALAIAADDVELVEVNPADYIKVTAPHYDVVSTLDDGEKLYKIQMKGK